MADEKLILEIQTKIDAGEAPKTLEELKSLSKEIHTLLDKTPIGTENFDKLKTAAQNVDKQLKETINDIKGYNKENQSLVVILKGSEKSINGFAKATQNLGNTLKSTAKSALPSFITEMGILDGELAATGIPELVIAIGLLIAGFVGLWKLVKQNAAAFEKIQEVFAGVHKVATVLVDKLWDFAKAFLNPVKDIKAVFNFYKTAFEDLANIILHPIESIKKLANAFLHPLDTLKELGSKVGGVISGIFGKIKKNVTDLNDAFKSGKDAAKQMNDLKVSAAKLNETLAEQKKKQEELEIQARDQTKTLAQRKQAAQDAIKLIQLQTSEKQKQAKAELEAYELETQGLKHLSADEQAHLEQLKANLSQIAADGIEQQKRNYNLMNSATEEQQKKDEEQRKKNAEDYKKSLDDKLKVLTGQNQIAINETKKDSDERVKAEIESANKEKDFYTQHYKALGLSKEDYTLKIQELDEKISDSNKSLQDKLKQQNLETVNNEQEIQDLKVQSVEKGSKAIVEAEKSVTESVTLNYDEQIQAAGKNTQKVLDLEKQKADKLKEVHKQELTDVKKNLDDEISLIKEQTISKINDSQSAENKEIQAAGNNQELILSIKEKYNQKILSLNDEMNDSISEANSKYVTEQNTLYKQDEANYKKISDEKKKIDEQEAKEKQSLEKETLTAVDNLGKLFTELEDGRRNQTKAQKEKAAKEEFELNKGLSLAKAIVNTAEAISKANTVAPPLNIPAMILAGVEGAAQIAAIAAAKFNSSSSSSGSGSGGGASSIQSVSSSSGSNSLIPPQQNLYGVGSQTMNNNQNNNQQPNQKVYVLESDITKTQKKVSVQTSRRQLSGSFA